MTATTPTDPSSEIEVSDVTIPADLSSALIADLVNRGLLEKAKLGPPAGVREIHGGAPQNEAEEHYCWRFTTSTSRVVRIVSDEKTTFSDIALRLLTVFSKGNVAILDIPSGTGAGTLGLLAEIANLRAKRLAPTLPLNVSIFAGDISQWSLTVFRDLATALAPKLQEASININISTKHWDATLAHETSALCNDWMDRSLYENDYFVLVSNFSGTSKSLLDSFKRSFEHLAERMAFAPATLLWIEPLSGTAATIRRKIKQFFSHVPILKLLFSEDSLDNQSCHYTWDCPITSRSKIKSSVSIVQFVISEQKNA